MGLFSFFRSAPKSSSGAAPQLRCRDLSRTQKACSAFWRQEQKGRSIHQVPALAFAELVENFTPEIRAYVEVLPLEEDAVDSIIMPVVRNLLLTVHLLPASESHHHCGAGGLLIHSLQTARFAVQSAEKLLLNANATAREQFRLSSPIYLVAALGMLIHDCGKTKDVVVVAENGEEWPADVCPLTLWLEGRSHYYVYWRPEREHKHHELASIRFAYSRLITQTLMSYLLEKNAVGLLDDAAEGILLGSGRFARVFKEAEELSIEAELTEKRTKRMAGVHVSVPVVAVILRAVKALVSDGQWHVNRLDQTPGELFSTSEGVFMAVTAKAGSQIRSAAVRAEGAEQVPASTESILRILSDAGVIERGPEGSGDGFWHLKRTTHDQEGLACVKFVGPVRECFPDGVEPPVIKAKTEGNTVRLLPCDSERESPQEPQIQQTRNEEQKAAVGIDLSSLQAPRGKFLVEPTDNSETPMAQPTAATAAEPDEDLLRPEELANSAGRRLAPLECRRFCQRLIHTAVRQLYEGKGELVEGGVFESESCLYAHSGPFEKVLASFGVDNFAYQTISRMLETPGNFRFDEKSRTIRAVKQS